MLPIRAEIKPPDSAVGHSGQGKQPFTTFSVPEDHFRSPGGGQEFTVRAVNDIVSPVPGITGQGLQLISGSGFPNLNCVVDARAGQALSIRTDGYAWRAAGMSGNRT